MKRLRMLGVGLVCSVCMVLMVLFMVKPVTADPPRPQKVDALAPAQVTQEHYLYLPFVTVNGSPPLPTKPTLCRLGYAGALGSLAQEPSFLVEPLRAEWLLSWGIGSWNNVTDEMRLGPSIWVKQWKEEGGTLVLTDFDAPYAEPYTYTTVPSIPEIQQMVSLHPGHLWFVGQEIERRDWQTEGGNSDGKQEILPEVYARLYHEVYHAIKAVDPTAKVGNGSVILPSPLRLAYLTRMWDEYVRLYHTPMPVDVWQTHLYLLPEKRGAWGADIPAGIDAQEGLFAFDSYEEMVLANKDFSHVPGLVREFRQWMKAHGQQNKPLLITEMAVSMPDRILEGEFTAEKIRDEFMYPLLDYIFQTTDPDLGYPDDTYHLVQSMWWWSYNLDDGSYPNGVYEQDYNSNLVWSGLGAPDHAPYMKGLTDLGVFWRDYVYPIQAKPNLYPLTLDPMTFFSTSGKAITPTIHLQVLNNGDVAANAPFTVTFRDYYSASIIDQIVINEVLEGCGEKVRTAGFQWPNLAPGFHKLWVIVDDGNAVAEGIEMDNTRVFEIFVSGFQLRLPMIIRP